MLGFLREPWAWLMAGGAALILKGKGAGGEARKNVTFPWTYPANAADKWQWFLDLTQLGYGGQGTVYINSWHGWDTAKNAMSVRMAPKTKTAKKVQFPIGFTCSRLTNVVCGYQCNAASSFHVNPAYSAKYQMTSSCAGEMRPRSGDTPLLVRGYKEYATKAIEHTHKHEDVYAAWDLLGQVNVWINEDNGSGHTGIYFRCDESFMLRDPKTRKPFGKCIVRLAADGGRPNSVYSVGRTALSVVEPGKVRDIGFEVWSLKLANNDSACKVLTGPYAGRQTSPLLFDGNQ